MTSRWIRPLVTATAAAGLIAAIAGSGASASTAHLSSSAPASGAVLTVGMPNGTQTDNSNPFVNTSSAQSLGYAYAIYEPLAQVNGIRPADDPLPWLASDWTWNDDYTSVTLTARDGVTWSDGEPFTADDIAYSFQLRKDNPALNSAALPYKDITVDGDQVTITFESGQFVNQSDLLNQFVVPEHIWSAVDDPSAFTNDDPVGTGPYVLEAWTPQAVTLTARDDYWGGAPGGAGAAVHVVQRQHVLDQRAAERAVAVGLDVHRRLRERAHLARP